MNRDRPTDRRGLTLVECLVVMAVIGLLVALVIPAVQAARHAARRSACRNNMRQIAVGVAHYESTNGSFPPGVGYSFLSRILPYIEETNLSHQMNFAGGLQSAAMDTVRSLTVGLYLCPADFARAEGGQSFGWTSYAGCRGRGDQKYGDDGMFRPRPGSVVRAAEVTDGLSSTALLSEWLRGGILSTDKDPRRPVFHTPERLTKPEEYDRFAVLCQSLDISTARINFNFKGQDWLWGEYGKSLYNHVVPVDSKTCLNGTAYQLGAWTASSLHPGGIHVGFADGGVRFIRQTIDLNVWRALGSRNGGEVLTQDGF